jgi:hypothetical protein
MLKKLFGGGGVVAQVNTLPPTFNMKSQEKRVSI